MVAHSDGAWLVYQPDGSTSEVPPAILAVRLDGGGQVVSDYIAVATDGSAATYGPFAAGRLGDKLVVASVDSFDPSAPTLILQVFDENGLVGATSLNTAPEWFSDDQLAVLGSPAGDQVLLGYASTVKDAPTRIHVARFDCVTGK
jgi:hypothetical protein